MKALLLAVVVLAGCGTATLNARDSRTPLLLGPVPALGQPTGDSVTVSAQDGGGFGPQMESVSVGKVSSFAKATAGQSGAYRVQSLVCSMSELFVLLAGHAEGACTLQAGRHSGSVSATTP